MMARTHMAIGFLCGLILIPFFDVNPFVFVSLIVLGAILPDVDHENSKINRLFPLTRWVPKFFQHRGFFHSVFPPVILFVLFYFSDLFFLGLPLIIGYVVHLVSDCLTKAGCNLLYPLSTFRIQGFVMTDSVMESVILICASVASLAVLAKQIGF